MEGKQDNTKYSVWKMVEAAKSMSFLQSTAIATMTSSMLSQNDGFEQTGEGYKKHHKIALIQGIMEVV